MASTPPSRLERRSHSFPMSTQHRTARRSWSAALLTGALVAVSTLGASLSAAATDNAAAESVRPKPPIVTVVSPLYTGGSPFADFIAPLVQPAPEPEPEPEPEPAPVATPEPAAPSGGDFASQVFAATNQVRIAHGLPPLAWSECAGASAANWSANLVGRGLAHQDMGAVRAACPPAFTAGRTWRPTLVARRTSSTPG